MAPLQREAVKARVAGLSNWGTSDVVIRDSLYTVVFAMLIHVCFSNGVDACHVRYMERMMQEFGVTIGEAKAFTRSNVAKLKHRGGGDASSPSVVSRPRYYSLSSQQGGAGLDIATTAVSVHMSIHSSISTPPTTNMKGKHQGA